MRSPMVEVVCWTSSKTARWLYMATMLPSLNVQMHPLIAKRIFGCRARTPLCCTSDTWRICRSTTGPPAVPARSAMSPDSGIGRSRLAPRQHLRLLRSLQVRGGNSQLAAIGYAKSHRQYRQPARCTRPNRNGRRRQACWQHPTSSAYMSGLQEVSGLLQKLAEGTISLEEASNNTPATSAAGR